MDQTQKNALAKSYFDASKDERINEYESVFFETCKKYHVSWCDASDGIKRLITAITDFTYDKMNAQKLGTSIENVTPLFSL